MEWIDYISYFFGGAFLTNALPHFVSGLMGRPFQSPFAKPRGEGLSSSVVNVFWGFFNIIVGYVLIFHLGNFDVRSIRQVLAMGLGVLSIAILLSYSFGRFNGGQLSKNKSKLR